MSDGFGEPGAPDVCIECYSTRPEPHAVTCSRRQPMERLSIAFGRRTYPDDVQAVWGARLIWPNDLVWDRQDMAARTAIAKEELKAWLNGTAKKKGALGKALAFLGFSGGKTGADRLWPDGQKDETEAVIYQDAKGKIVGSPQGSYGYVYVAAWLHEGKI